MLPNMRSSRSDLAPKTNRSNAVPKRTDRKADERNGVDGLLPEAVPQIGTRAQPRRAGNAAHAGERGQQAANGALRHVWPDGGRGSGPGHRALADLRDAPARLPSAGQVGWL